MSTWRTSSLLSLSALALLSTASLPALAQDPGPAALAKARAAYDAGAWTKAASLYEQAYAASPKNAVTRVEADLERGALLWEQGRYASASKGVKRAMSLAKKLKLEEALGRTLLTLGQIETSQGKLSSAQRTFRICSSEASERGDVVYASLCRLNASLVQRLRGKSGMSDAQVQAAIGTIKSAATPRATGLALAKTADLYLKNKNYPQAMALLKQAQGQFAQAKSVPAGARTRVRMAQVHQNMNQWSQAQGLLTGVLPTLRRMNHRPLLAQSYGMLGRGASEQGDKAQAQTHYVKAISYAKATGSPQLVASTNLAMCELYPSPRNEDERYCEAAIKGFESVGAKALQARALSKMANLRQQQQRLSEAKVLHVKTLGLLDASSKSAEHKRAGALQAANLCQVEHTMKATGSLRACNGAIKRMNALPEDQRNMDSLGASYYAAAFGAQRERRWRDAITHFERAAMTYATMSEPHWTRASDAQLRLGTMLTQLKKKEAQAQAALEKGLGWSARATDAQGKLVRKELLLQLSQHLLFQKKYAQALPHLNALVKQAASDPDSQGWAYNGLAQAHLKLGDKAKAVESLKLGIKALTGSKDRHQILEMMKNNLKTLES